MKEKMNEWMQAVITEGIQSEKAENLMHEMIIEVHEEN